MTNITLRQLQAFLAVSELCSFTRAAERLGLSQSAVSVLVGELERELRVKLMDRTTRRVELTQAGQHFAARVHKIVFDLAHAVQHAHDYEQRLYGRLIVAAPPLLATLLIPGAIAAHRALWPGIDITLVDCGTDQLVSQIRDGAVDLGIGTVPADTPDLHMVPLAMDNLMLFCLADHPLAQRQQVGWKDLEAERLVALTWQSELRRLMDQAARAAGAALKPAFEVAQISTAVAMVDAGLGITVLPSIVHAMPGYPSLVMRPLSPAGHQRMIQAVSRRGRELPPAGHSFIASIRSELKRLASLHPRTVGAISQTIAADGPRARPSSSGPAKPQRGIAR